MSLNDGPRINDMSAAERNKQAIFDALLPWLANVGSVFEIGSGDATHARYAARHLPQTRWQTSEAPGHVRRLAAAIADDRELADNQLPQPLALDVRQAWPQETFDAVYAANVAHIMGWSAVCALFAGVGQHLNAGGVFGLYGPFFGQPDRPPADSNQRFDASLRAQSPEMGIRDVADLDTLATTAGLTYAARIAMPANNDLLIWRLPAS